MLRLERRLVGVVEMQLELGADAEPDQPGRIERRRDVALL
jgi:hypothetical protein